MLIFFQNLPSSNLTDMSKVCRTFSLATLQNVFPPERFWRQGNATPAPAGAAPYVEEFISEKATQYLVQKR